MPREAWDYKVKPTEAIILLPELRACVPRCRISAKAVKKGMEGKVLIAIAARRLVDYYAWCELAKRLENQTKASP
jgi:hypothetical protein